MNKESAQRSERNTKMSESKEPVGRTLKFEVVQYNNTDLPKGKIVAHIKVAIIPAGGKMPRGGLTLTDLEREVYEYLHGMTVEAFGEGPLKDVEAEIVGGTAPRRQRLTDKQREMQRRRRLRHG